MARKNRISVSGNFQRVISLLSLLATIGIAAATNPVPLINQPLLPDTAKPGSAGFTLTVNGTGFFSGGVVKWNGSSRATTFVSSSQLKASILSSDIAKAGTASVTVVNPSGVTSNTVLFEVTPSSSSVGFTVPSAFSIGTNAWSRSVALGDFNADGKIDLAVAGVNDISVLLGNGDGTFQPEVEYDAGIFPNWVAVEDFNNDGKLDLAVANYGSNNVSILLGNGDGTFQAAVNYGAGSAPDFVAVGDFNGDGKADLAVANYDDNNVSLLLGNGDGTFKTATNYATGSNPYSVAVGDFNGDGKLDLVVANYGSNSLSILLGNGDGTFQAAVNYGVGTGPYSVAVADLNRDGKLDLAVANLNSSDISVLLGNSDGTFQAAVSYDAGVEPRSVAVADFNADSKLDFVTADGTGANVNVLLGNGDGTFQAAVPYGAGPRPSSVVVGDFNGDGRLDLAAADLHSNDVWVLLQDTIVSLSKTSLTFGNQVVGTTSTSQTVTLTNGALPLTIRSVAVTGTNPNDFGQTNTCGSSVPAGGSCTISVTFKPTQVGPRTASVTVTDNGASSTQTITLSGTGVVSGPNVTLSVTRLIFATQLLNTTSPAQSITLTNYGTTALNIIKTSFTGANPGDYAETNTCGSSLAAGASCTISVTFTPKSINSRTATLSITDNAPGSPQGVSLSGTGTMVELLPTSLVFCNFLCGPRTKSVTMTNVGSTTLNIGSIKITGTDADDFSQTHTCGSSLAAGASCTISVTSNPDARLEFAALQISDDGGGSPQYVFLEFVYGQHF